MSAHTSCEEAHGLQLGITGGCACVIQCYVPPNVPRHGILVASDAIGMGLNLNIRRVIFTSLSKFDGKLPDTTSVTPSPSYFGYTLLVILHLSNV
jgi:hypothetical protein